MARGSVQVTVRANARLAVAAIRALTFLAPLIGWKRAWDIATWTALHLTFVKVGNGHWRRMKP